MTKEELVDRILRRKWAPGEIEKYVGHAESCWLTYSLDEQIRNNAASGGTITGLLAWLLDRKIIDGVLVCTSTVVANEVQAGYRIATTREELIAAQGSKYIETNFTSQAVPLIQQFPGKLALVLLPCDTLVVDQLCKKNPDFQKNIVLKISLFCGHVSEPALTRLIIRKGKTPGVSLTGLRYRIGHWRGKTVISYEDGSETQRPFGAFSSYQNLFYYCAKKCLYCHDHTGYLADISVGDVWLQRMKNNPIKHNTVIIRSGQAAEWRQNAHLDGYLYCQEVGVDFVAEAQSRSLPMHYNVSARVRAGKKLGIALGDPVNERVRFIDYLVAYFTMLNYRWSHTVEGRLRIGRIPRPIIKLYLYFLKTLQVLQ